jgi:hypothetical protein
MNYDIFNGDADGVIALLQWRFAYPEAQPHQLITGVKRDIKLLNKIKPTKGDLVTVFDISMSKNESALTKVLSAGANVFYADHHMAPKDYQHLNLEAHIDLDPNTCTSLIVNNLLNGQFQEWAIAAAYGDNMLSAADNLADSMGLSNEQKQQLQEVGVLINYNGYGSCLEDLNFEPADLYRKLTQYQNPFDLAKDAESPYHVLKQAYSQDMVMLERAMPLYESGVMELYILPNNASSRRVSGIFGNQLANKNPTKAFAVLTTNPLNSKGHVTYTVSLRAPLNNKQGAAQICSNFDTGGGREAAAGINELEDDDIGTLIALIEEKYDLTMPKR